MVDMTACMQLALVRSCLTFQTMQRPSLPKILTHLNKFCPVWWCWLFLRVRGYSEGLTNHCRPMLLFFSSGSQFTRTNVTLLGQESVHSGSAGWGDCGAVFPGMLSVSSFPIWKPICPVYNLENLSTREDEDGWFTKRGVLFVYVRMLI